MSALLRLYPRDWRTRYEDEFLSLLAERPPDVRDRVDIVRGAIDARLRPQVRRGSVEPGPEAPRASVSSRVVGVLTLVGAGLWFATLVVAANGPVVVDEGGSYRDGAAAIPFGLLAFLLLGAGLVQVARSLPPGADAGGLAAAAAATCGAIWALMPWVLPLLVLTSVSYVILAVAARRAGMWGVVDTVLVIGGVVAAWVLIVVALNGVRSTTEYMGFLAFWIALSSVWFGVAHALITRAPAPAPEKVLTRD